MNYRVIIPAFNNPDLTYRCVKSLPREPTIYVVDDGSDPCPASTYDELDDTHGIDFHRHDTNRGTTAAWNTGARKAIAQGHLEADDALVFLNNDIVVRHDTVPNLVRTLDFNPKVGIVGATEIPASASGRFNPEDLFRPRVDETEIEPGSYMSAFAVRVGLYRQLGGFDARMRLVFSDTDFVLRAQEAGFETVVCRGALVYHGKSVTRKRLGAEQDTAQDIRDMAVFLEKWKHRPDVQKAHGIERASLGDPVMIKKAYWVEGEH